MEDWHHASRISYLIGDNNVVYPCDNYLDFITPSDIFEIIINDAIPIMNGLYNKIIWDMFAGIGTDTIRLAKHAGKVIASEINPCTFKCLEKNISESGFSNISVYNEDCCSLKLQVNPDIVYFDPPWGSSFKSGQLFTFDHAYLSNGSSITDVLLELLRTYKEAYFIIKAPYNCDIEKNIPEEEIICILSFNRQKLKFIFKRPSSDHAGEGDYALAPNAYADAVRATP